MAIDFREIQLTDDQKRRLAELAEQSGKAWNEILNERLADSNEPANDEALLRDDVTYIEDFDAWLAHFNDWMNRQRKRNPNVDDSRDSIYPDRW